MKITRSQLIQIIMEELELGELSDETETWRHEGMRRGAPTHPERLARDHPYQANVQDTQFQTLMDAHGGRITDTAGATLVTFDNEDKRRSAYDAARAKGYSNLKYHNVPGAAAKGAHFQLMLHK